MTDKNSECESGITLSVGNVSLFLGIVTALGYGRGGFRAHDQRPYRKLAKALTDKIIAFGNESVTPPKAPPPSGRDENPQRAPDVHPAPVDKFAKAAGAASNPKRSEMNQFSVGDMSNGHYTFNMAHPDVSAVVAEHSYTWDVSKAAFDVVKERARQVGGEHFDIFHDDKEKNGALWKAAVSYAYAGSMGDGPAPVPNSWPWSNEWWKPGTRRRNLVKAAALLIAEIECLDRKGTPYE